MNGFIFSKLRVFKDIRHLGNPLQEDSPACLIDGYSSFKRVKVQSPSAQIRLNIRRSLRRHIILIFISMFLSWEGFRVLHLVLFKPSMLPVSVISFGILYYLKPLQTLLQRHSPNTVLAKPAPLLVIANI